MQRMWNCVKTDIHNRLESLKLERNSEGEGREIRRGGETDGDDTGSDKGERTIVRGQREREIVRGKSKGIGLVRVREVKQLAEGKGLREIMREMARE